MAIHRLKHSFTAGELSPLMNDRVDFERYKNGCRKLHNMVCVTQGPASRRPGFKFIYDLNLLGLDVEDPRVRTIPFIFNENQAYVMIFFMHTDGFPRMVLGTTNTDGEDGLVLGSGDDCIYKTETRLAFTGPADYEVSYTEGSTVNSVTVVHRGDDGVTTDLVDPGDYTFTDVGNVITLTVTNSTISDDGYLTIILDLESPAIPIDEVVTLYLPADWDISKFDWAQSGDEMYIAQPELNPHIIQRFGHDCWQLISVSFNEQPEDWSDEYGWPERVAFHQQRLCFASNKLRRQTVWMTQAGDFSSFAISSPLVDSDAVTFTLDSGTQNKIQWMTSGKSLHIGTMGNEWTVVGNDRSALTPSNILAQKQTNNGSEPNKALLVGLTTLFVERHGRTVNEFVYDYDLDSYKNIDMAILSPHVTQKFSITDWTYQQTPDSIIWCVREDGNLLGITYQRQHKVIGWHQHSTNGQFKAIASIPGNTREDDIWTIVKRDLPTGERYYIEKMFDWFLGTETIDARFLDSCAVYAGEPTSLITGLDHLAGLSVSILADGTVHQDRFVSVDGELGLDNYFSVVAIGLSYESELWPLVVEVPQETGTMLGRMQRVTNIDIDLYSSLGLEYGRYDSEDGEHVEELPFRTPGNFMGQAVPLFTGWKHLAFPEGFDREVSYFIRQRQPLPLTVRGIVDTVEVFE